MVCISALMVEIEAQMSDRRNSDTKRSPNVMLLNTSTMYVGMMKSTPFVTYWKALIPSWLSKKYRLQSVPHVYAAPTMTKMKMEPITIERVSVLSSLADMYLTTSCGCVRAPIPTPRRNVVTTVSHSAVPNSANEVHPVAPGSVPIWIS